MSSSSPRSIVGYLLALRAALAGADPALIQDALYDAEEHLRAEAAANPEMPEAELLEHVTRTYGAPDEVAAAYRDSEAKVAAALQPPIFRRAQSRQRAEPILLRVFRPARLRLDLLHGPQPRHRLPLFHLRRDRSGALTRALDSRSSDCPYSWRSSA